MMNKRIQLGLILLLAVFLLGACDQVEVLSERADVSRIEEAEFYGALQQTVGQVQMLVLLVGFVNLLGGWKLGRFGLALNGFVIGSLMIYTYLNDGTLVQDETTMRGLAIAGGVVAGLLTFFAYNLMALIIGGAIGMTLMGGAWLQVADNVPPQLLVFLTTFVSAMVMFVIFRLFLVAFSAVIGAALLMLAVPFETVWVIPVAAIGTLMQTGIAFWIGDDIFRNLRGDLGAAVGEAFGEVLGPVGVLRERQRGAESAPARQSRQRAPKPSRTQEPAPSPQQYRPPQQPPPQQPYQPPQQQPPQQQPYQPPQQRPPAHQQAPPPQYGVRPQPVPPRGQDLGAVDQTQPMSQFRPEAFRIVLSDGRTFPLDGPQMVVGRNADNAITVNDPQVSGRHLVFSVQPEGVVVWDNNSTNGTYLNGVLLRGSHRLIPQDVLQIGATTLRLVRQEQRPG